MATASLIPAAMLQSVINVGGSNAGTGYSYIPPLGWYVANYPTYSITNVNTASNASNWNTLPERQYVATSVVSFWSQFATLSAEEIERLHQESEERRKKEKLAAERAQALLESSLSHEQREQFKANGEFDLEVNGRLYRIRPGARVVRLDKSTKKVTSLFCIHPSDRLPLGDEALAQKLLLETNEQEFLRIANETKAA